MFILIYNQIGKDGIVAMKKITLTLLIIMILVIVCSITTSASQIISSVLTTDIKAYINGDEIPAYNINGNMVIIGSDLRNYGFNVEYNNETRTSTISISEIAGTWTPYKMQTTNNTLSGMKIMDVLDTDISVIINGNNVEAYNVDGQMAFKFSELKEFGTYGYSNETRSSNLYIPNIDSNRIADTIGPSTISVFSSTGHSAVIRENDKTEALRNGWYTNRFDAVASAYPKQNIRILNIEPDLNSVGGSEPNIYWRNDSGKTIKYITFYVVPYNAVGDIVSCRITHDTYAALKATGPFATYPDQDKPFNYFYTEILTESVWHYGDTAPHVTHAFNYKKYFLQEGDENYIFDQLVGWEPVWYNSTIESIKINNVTIEYMDGTYETINNPPIWYEVFKAAGIKLFP